MSEKEKKVTETADNVEVKAQEIVESPKTEEETSVKEEVVDADYKVEDEKKDK